MRHLKADDPGEVMCEEGPVPAQQLGQEPIFPCTFSFHAPGRSDDAHTGRGTCFTQCTNSNDDLTQKYPQTPESNTWLDIRASCDLGRFT